jgi:hypothetical protein
MLEAQQKLRDLFNSIVSDEKTRSEFNLFDTSVSQKLWSTRYYFDELKDLNTEKYPKNYLVLPHQDDTQSTNDPTTNQPSLMDMPSYCLDLSRILDGFFMNSMSVLDTLAHLISTVYYFPPEEFKYKNEDRIYILGIKKALPKYHPNSEIEVLLDKRLKQDWFTEFAPFRHCTTHESLIPYDVNLGYDFINKRWHPPEIRLADNPQIRPPQQPRNREAISFCQTIFDNIESLLNEVYEAIRLDIQNNNNNLIIGKP